MKDRFWKEVQHGSKFYALTGIEFDGLYKKTEVINLCRYIGQIKNKELSWRKNHSYLIADKHEFKLVDNTYSDDKNNQTKTKNKTNEDPNQDNSNSQKYF